MEAKDAAMVSTDFTPGSPNWIDLGSPDIPASTAFYGGLLGWEFVSAGPEAGGYGFFRLGGKTVGAIGPLSEEGAVPAWTIYFHTPDADATTKVVEQAGGTVRVPPMDVFDAGRLAQFTDPTGGDFAVWQPGTTEGLEVVGSPGAFIWSELHTGDVPRALAFYRAVFAWRSEDSGLPGIEYTIVSTAEGDDPQAAGVGGIAPPHEKLRTGWLPYFTVEDTDAAAALTHALGGTVLLPPGDVPQVGRIAVFADPSGAEFAVIKPEPPQ
ncbi:VOC family protein [Kitasatospora camelliae]|uniref:VOC family protein n=1 Tax=Kitasatospora camelliae TaxID=3156397 RepID=A0AAU8JTG7_9ACTN